jgi:hypothetical protein
MPHTFDPDRSFDPPSGSDGRKLPPGSPTPYAILPETGWLAAIGCIDLLTTMYLLSTGQAREANGLMAFFLHTFGGYGFVGAKAVMLGAPLATAELARKRNEPFVRSALRMGIILYLGMYAILFAQMNVRGQ